MTNSQSPLSASSKSTGKLRIYLLSSALLLLFFPGIPSIFTQAIFDHPFPSMAVYLIFPLCTIPFVLKKQNLRHAWREHKMMFGITILMIVSSLIALVLNFQLIGFRTWVLAFGVSYYFLFVCVISFVFLRDVIPFRRFAPWFFVFSFLSVLIGYVTMALGRQLSISGFYFRLFPVEPCERYLPIEALCANKSYFAMVILLMAFALLAYALQRNRSTPFRVASGAGFLLTLALIFVIKDRTTLILFGFTLSSFGILFIRRISLLKWSPILYIITLFVLLGYLAINYEKHLSWNKFITSVSLVGRLCQWEAVLDVIPEKTHGVFVGYGIQQGFGDTSATYPLFDEIVRVNPKALKILKEHNALKPALNKRKQQWDNKRLTIDNQYLAILLNGGGINFLIYLGFMAFFMKSVMQDFCGIYSHRLFDNPLHLSTVSQLTAYPAVCLISNDGAVFFLLATVHFLVAPASVPTKLHAWPEAETLDA